MIKLVAALANARDNVDRSIALGEAIPRLERLRRTILWGLVVTVTVLSVSLIHLSRELETVRENQVKAEQARVTMLAYLEKADRDNQTLLKRTWMGK